MNMLAKAAKSFYEQLMNIAESHGKDWQTLDDLIARVTAVADDVVPRSIEAIVALLNAEYFVSDERKDKGLVVKEHTTKAIHTSIGDISVPRDTYQKDGKGKCVAPIFEKLEITAHQRTSHEMMRRVTAISARTSFQDAANALKAGVCRQTVINWLRNEIPMLEVPVDEKTRSVPVLHIFVDEDHLSMLKDPTRKHMIMPIGVVCEGREQVCHGRYRLIHPRYFMDPDLSPKGLIASMIGYISAQYDQTAIQTIYVHGDGASWIVNGFEELANAQHALDGFHFIRALNRCVRRFGEDKETVRSLLETAVQTNNKDMAEAVLTTFGGQSGDEHIRKKTDEFQTYMLNNWDAIVCRCTSCPMGSCTEAMVFHVASERMSSTPHGWSRLTVGRLAALRTFEMNGGSLEDDGGHSQPAGTHAKYIDKYIEDLLAKSYDFSLCEHQTCAVDKNSGTQHLMGITNHGGQLPIGQ